MGAPGLGYIVFEADGGKGPIAKFHSADVQQKIAAKAGVKLGDAVFFAADKPASAAKLAGAAAHENRRGTGTSWQGSLRILLDRRFPMYEWNEEEKKIDFSPQSILDAESARRRFSRARCQGQR